MKYRADAKRGVCWLPLNGIFWLDEIADLREFMQLPAEDRLEILRLFSIRVKLWRSESLSDAETQFWNQLREQTSGWAFFHRTTVTSEELKAQADAERDTAQGFQAILDEADEVTVTEKDGIKSFSATFDLTKIRGEA